MFYPNLGLELKMVKVLIGGFRQCREAQTNPELDLMDGVHRGMVSHAKNGRSVEVQMPRQVRFLKVKSGISREYLGHHMHHIDRLSYSRMVMN